MRMNKKLAAGVAAGTIALSGGGVALAYWTATGTGSGTAVNTAGASKLVVLQKGQVTDLYPGGPAQTITGTIKNDAKNSAFVHQVAVSISGVLPGPGGAAGCSAADYTLASNPILVDKDIASGQTVEFSGSTIQFNTTDKNQDACKGATVYLKFDVS